MHIKHAPLHIPGLPNMPLSSAEKTKLVDGLTESVGKRESSEPSFTPGEALRYIHANEELEEEVRALGVKLEEIRMGAAGKSGRERGREESLNVKVKATAETLVNEGGKEEGVHRELAAGEEDELVRSRRELERLRDEVERLKSQVQLLPSSSPEGLVEVRKECDGDDG